MEAPIYTVHFVDRSRKKKILHVSDHTKEKGYNDKEFRFLLLKRYIANGFRVIKIVREK